MNLKQLTAFRELMLTGSVSQAARNLNRTQPSVSHLIASLEVELGMTLFARRGGRLHPVPEADYLLEECKMLLHRIDTVSLNMRRMKAMESGELRMASMPGPATVLLPELICSLVGEHPDVRTTLLSRSTEAVHQLVSMQQFDLGLADHDPTRSLEGSLAAADTWRFDCQCALPAGHSLADNQPITAKDLDGEPLASLFAGHLVHDATTHAFATAGARMNVRFEAQFFIQLLTFVRNGLACAVVDPLTVEAYRLLGGPSERIVFRPLQPSIEFAVDILTPGHRPASLLASAFIDSLHDRFTALGGRRQTS